MKQLRFHKPRPGLNQRVGHHYLTDGGIYMHPAKGKLTLIAFMWNKDGQVVHEFHSGAI
jgi:hypothetical protein